MRWLSFIAVGAFPLCGGAGPPHRWEAALGQAYRGPKRTILCIDDDNAILQYERALLERCGYNVVATASAQQGLTLAMMLPADAVILDYHMPGINGHNVAAAIKKCRPEILIVMFSGSEIPEETFTLVDAVVFKTDAIGQLVPTVTQLLQQA
jgi:CheY-like chemotaxis protein